MSQLKLVTARGLFILFGFTISAVCMISGVNSFTANVQSLSATSTSFGEQNFASAEPTYTLYEDPTFGYSIEYPEESSPEPDETGVSFYIPSIGAGAGVSLFDATGTTLSQFVNERLSVIESAGMNVETPSSDVLAGQDAGLTSYSGTTETGKPVAGVLKMTVSDNIGYMLNFFTSPDSVDAFVPIAQHMVNSFQIPSSISEGSDLTGGLGSSSGSSSPEGSDLTGGLGRSGP